MHILNLKFEFFISITWPRTTKMFQIEIISKNISLKIRKQFLFPVFFADSKRKLIIYARQTHLLASD